MVHKGYIMPKIKQSKKTPQTRYIKLSSFGVFIWIGLFISSWVSFVKPLFLVIFFPLLVGTFCKDAYSEYVPTTDDKKRIFSIHVSGRLSCLSYWWILLFSFVGSMLLYISRVNTSTFAGGMLAISIWLIIWFKAAAIRRAQDCGWNSWTPLIPFTGIILLFIPSEKKDNRYGPYIKKQTTVGAKSKNKTVSKTTKMLKKCVFVILSIVIIALLFWLPNIYEQRKAYATYKATAIAGFQKQNIDIKDVKFLSRKEINKVLKSSNKYYISLNGNKIAEAMKVYSYVLSLRDNIDFCQGYYPAKQLQTEYKKTFFQTGKKAENILVNAFGKEGFKLLILKTFFSNQHLRLKTIEKDYQAMKQEANKEGITDFSRTQYCQILDNMASELAQNAKKEFQTLFPGFYVKYSKN